MLVRTTQAGILLCLMLAPVALASEPDGDAGKPADAVAPLLSLSRMLTWQPLHSILQDDERTDRFGEGEHVDRYTDDASQFDLMDEEGEANLPPHAMHEARRSEFEQGMYELRIGAYIWFASIDAVSETSSADMRLAEALGNLSVFGTSIQHIDLVEEMKLARSRVIINPEISIRFNNSVIRLSWWWFRETSTVVPSKIYTFGDVVYCWDADGPDPVTGRWNQRIPPDSPSSLIPPKIDFTAELMDTKLIYELRAMATTKFELYIGLGVHWFRYTAQGDTDVRVYTSYPDGSVRDRKKVDDDQFGDYPLVSISLRAEWRPRANIYLNVDLQEMYLYYGNYTDLKLGIWNQIFGIVRVGAGFRLWNVQCELYNLGGSKMTIDANVVLMGFWVGAFVII